MKKQDVPFSKTDEQFFLDWECAVFGYGYGSGERHTLKSLKDFLSSFDHRYDYEELEKKLGGELTWLMITILAKVDILEYGTSPRYAWLTNSGELLQKFVKKHSVDELYEIVMNQDEYDESGVAHCDYSNCNCYPEQMSGVCRHNPFLNEKVADKMKYSPHK